MFRPEQGDPWKTVQTNVYYEDRDRIERNINIPLTTY